MNACVRSGFCCKKAPIGRRAPNKENNTVERSRRQPNDEIRELENQVARLRSALEASRVAVVESDEDKTERDAEIRELERRVARLRSALEAVRVTVVETLDDPEEAYSRLAFVAGCLMGWSCRDGVPADMRDDMRTLATNLRRPSR